MLVIVAPVVIGAGLGYYPDVLTPLALRDVRRFSNGMVRLRYDVTSHRAGTDSVAVREF